MIMIEADLLKSEEAVIVHGCNALGKFGAGFAKGVRELHPDAWQAYDAAHRNSGLVLGSVIWAPTRSGRLIGHCITQYDYGRDSKRRVDYDAVRSCMRAIELAAREGVPGSAFEDGFTRVAMPMIGAGLAGGNWNVISQIISEEIASAEARIYQFNPRARVNRSFSAR